MGRNAPRLRPALPASFLGTQALLLRRRALGPLLAGWDSVAGLQSQRLATFLRPSDPLWIHRPSLVQHVTPDSSWGALPHRALDFDPSWEEDKTVKT